MTLKGFHKISVEKLWKILKPELLRNAPNVNMLKPKPKAGTPRECLIPCLI